MFAYVREDNGPVVVVVKEKEPIRDPHTNRAPAKLQVECYYHSYSNAIELSFLSNLGTVNVVLENQTTGEIQNYVGNSATGRMVIYVEPDSAYRMDIVTESGRDYFAQFFAGEKDSDS